MPRRLRVLFVCAMNKRRSATAGRVYRNDPRVEARSAGVRANARRRVSENDLRWADIVFVMERSHKLAITTRFGDTPGLTLPPIDVLDIPDEFEFMDPNLIEILETMLDPEIDCRVSKNRMLIAGARPGFS